MDTIKKTVFFLLFLLFSAQVIGAQPINTASADTLFSNRKYKQAFEQYDAIFQQGQYSPQMLLKMSYIKEGTKQYAQALYYLSLYAKAHPSEEVFKKMDDLANAQELYGYAWGDSAFFSMLYLRHKSWIVLSMGLVALSGAAGIYLLKKRGSAVGAPLLLLTLYIIGAAWVFNGIDTARHGIVAKDGTLMMDNPSAGGRLLATLEAGNKLEIIGATDIWLMVRMGEQEGYVRQSNLWMLQ